MYAERELPVFVLSKIWRQNSTVAIRTIVPFSMQLSSVGKIEIDIQ